MLVKKYTLLVDEQWEKAILEKFYPYVESNEVFQLLDEEEVELCDDCQVYLTKDGEVVSEVYMCDNQHEYCLNCCKCPGDHEEGGYYDAK